VTPEKPEDILADIEDAKKCLQTVRFNSKSFRHQIIISFYTSIIEFSESIKLLLDSGKTFDSEIILRSLLEYFVELKNTIDFPEHHLNVQYKFIKKSKLQLENAKSGNPFFSKIVECISINEELSSLVEKQSYVADLGGTEK